MIGSIILLVCITVAAAQREKVPFIPERVQLVDKVGSNYLVRGNLPITKGKFVYEQLKKQLQRVTGVPSAKQQLIIYSLINHYTDSEGSSALLQQQYFNTNPTAGTLYFYPIFGYFISPQSLPGFLMRFAASYYQSVSYDKLQYFLDLIREELSTGKNKIVYFHCTHGADRTGLVAGAYKMKYHNESLKSVMEENVKIAKRDLKWTVVNGINWFCQQLKTKNEKVECEMEERNGNPPEKTIDYQL